MQTSTCSRGWTPPLCRQSGTVSPCYCTHHIASFTALRPGDCSDAALQALPLYYEVCLCNACAVWRCRVAALHDRQQPPQQAGDLPHLLGGAPRPPQPDWRLQAVPAKGAHDRTTNIHQSIQLSLLAVMTALKSGSVQMLHVAGELCIQQAAPSLLPPHMLHHAGMDLATC
jgi:hypothetical protein